MYTRPKSEERKIKNGQNLKILDNFEEKQFFFNHVFHRNTLRHILKLFLPQMYGKLSKSGRRDCFPKCCSCIGTHAYYAQSTIDNLSALNLHKISKQMKKKEKNYEILCF